MNISTTKLESTLVSMAGTLIYLREMSATLAKKPVVPKAVGPLMSATLSEMAALDAQFDATRRAAIVDAQPFLSEWLRRTGLLVGGIFRGQTFAYGTGLELHLTGGIEDARLHCYAVAGIRVVDFTLSGAQIVLPTGVASVIDDIPVKEQALYNLVALRDVEIPDRAAGVIHRELHVRVPIQETERTGWARCGKLVL